MQLKWIIQKNLIKPEVLDSFKRAFNQLDAPDGLIEFVERKANDYAPHEIFVMDLAQTKHVDQYKIIECNCFNGTGFYNHNITSIINAITENCLT